MFVHDNKQVFLIKIIDKNTTTFGQALFVLHYIFISLGKTSAIINNITSQDLLYLSLCLLTTLTNFSIKLFF